MKVASLSTNRITFIHLSNIITSLNELTKLIRTNFLLLDSIGGFGDLLYRELA